MPKYVNLFFWFSIGLGWVFDLLFWDVAVGISFPIFVWFTVAVGLYLAHKEEIKPAKASLWLLLPIAIFSVMSIMRAEPFTAFINRSFTLVFMLLFASSFTGGKWIFYQIVDYFGKGGAVILSALSRAGVLFFMSSKGGKSDEDGEDVPVDNQVSFKKVFPVIRGIILSLPIILIFGGLLSAADPIFSEFFYSLLEFFRIELLPEYMVRFTFIIILAYMLIGVYFYALYKSEDERIPREKSLLIRFVGFTEAMIVMGSVVSLFGAFVVIQVQYFFGGQENIKLDGFTYAEYARRGFSELLMVAFLSMLLFLVMSAATKRSGEQQQKIFSGMSIALVALIAVMLVSAYKRLTLYEYAFGFSRLRMYAHIFMIWIGVFLIAVAILEMLGRHRNFVFASMLAAVGFALTLNLVNVDAFIAKENILRLKQFNISSNDLSSAERQRISLTVDMGYIASLSNDVVPTIEEVYLSAAQDNNEEIAEIAAAALQCHAYLNNTYDLVGRWQGFIFPDLFAYQAWEELDDDLVDLEQAIRFDDDDWAYVELAGDQHFCEKNFQWD